MSTQFFTVKNGEPDRLVLVRYCDGNGVSFKVLGDFRVDEDLVDETGRRCGLQTVLTFAATQDGWVRHEERITAALRNVCTGLTVEAYSRAVALVQKFGLSTDEAAKVIKGDR